MPKWLFQPLSSYGIAVASILGFAILFWRYSLLALLQWDFGVYYLAAFAYHSGGNPYDPGTLSVIGASMDGVQYHGLPFLYPPVILHFFRLFTLVDIHTAAFVWLLLKCAALLGSIFLILRISGAGVTPLSLFCAYLFALYYRPIGLDFSAGNVAIFESTIILAGLLAWMQGRHALWGVGVGLAGAMKAAPLLLALEPLHRRDSLFFAGLLSVVVVTGLVMLLDYPTLLHYWQFIRGPIWENHWDEQAQSIYNLSSLSFVLRTFSGTYFFEPLYESPLMVSILVPGIPLAVVLSLFWAIRQRDANETNNPADPSLMSAMIVALLLIPPRLADYTLVWAFLPIFHGLWRWSAERRWLPLLLLVIGAILIHWDYPPSRVGAGWAQLLADKNLFGLLFIYTAYLVRLKDYSKSAEEHL